MHRVPLVASLVSVTAGTDCGFNNDMCVFNNKGTGGEPAQWATSGNDWAKVSNTVSNTDATKGCQGPKGRVACLGDTLLVYGNNKLSTQDTAGIKKSIDKYTGKMYNWVATAAANPAAYIKSDIGAGTPPYAGDTWFWCVNISKAGTLDCTGDSTKYVPNYGANDADKNDYLKNMGACKYRNPEDGDKPEYDYDCCATEYVGFCDDGYQYEKGTKMCTDILDQTAPPVYSGNYEGVTKKVIESAGVDFFTTKCTPCPAGMSADDCKKAGQNKKPEVKEARSSSCFAGSALAQSANGSIKVADLKIGDMVKTATGFEPIIGFLHAEEGTATFVEITHPAGKLPLTGDHLIFLADGRAVTASSIKVGDKLPSGEVTEVAEVIRNDGIYAPMTKSGTIAVENTMASTYSSVNSVSHSVAHFATAPLRWLGVSPATTSRAAAAYAPVFSS